MGHETLHGTVPAQMGMLDSTVRRYPVGNRWEMQIFCFALCLCLSEDKELFSFSLVLLLFEYWFC